MSNQEINNAEKHNQEKGVDEKRRSITKVGIVAPVVMTLASKSALGASFAQCSVSGMMSGNASHPDEGRCEGCTPGYWKNHPENWPGNPTPGTCDAVPGNSGHCKTSGSNVGEYTGGTVFSTWFTCSRDSTRDSQTMIDLLMEPQTYWTLHAHAVAALLNSITLTGYGNTSQDILDWWCDLSLSDEDLKNRYESLNERYCPL